MQVMCGRTPNCGFRVHDRYYVEKPQFARNICARCNGPILIVADDTDDKVQGAVMNKETGRLSLPVTGGA
jgi:hypothetical protein